MYGLLSTDTRIVLPAGIELEMTKFIQNMNADGPDLKSLGIKATTLPNVLENLKRIYNLIEETEINV